MRTTAQERQSQLLADLVAARKRILEVADSFAPEQGDVIFLGTWSVKDLIAHLIGWDFTNIQAMQDICADQLPQFYAFHDRDWQTFNAQLVGAYKKDDLTELLGDALASQQQLIAYLQTLPAEEFDRDRGLRFRGWKVTMARLLRAEVEDEQKHYTQIKTFVEQNSDVQTKGSIIDNN
jgi:hypothetical protein